MRWVVVAASIVTASLLLVWVTAKASESRPGPASTPSAHSDMPGVAEGSIRTAHEAVPAPRREVGTNASQAKSGFDQTTSDAGPAEPSTAWVVPDVFARTRTAPAEVDVAELQASAPINPDGGTFSAELRESLGHELEQLRASHARITAEIERVQTAEFAEAAKSGFATRDPVETRQDAQGNDTIQVTFGVPGEESEVVFGEHGAEVVRVPARLMPETNALRAAWLAEWLEFWHATLPLLERAGHLDNERSDSIYEGLFAEFEGALAGYEVSFEELQKRRKRR